MTDAQQRKSSRRRGRRQRPDDGSLVRAPLDLKALLAAAPLEGVELERDQRSGRPRTGSDPRTSSYPLRLPVSLKAAVERLSRRDGTSMNQFMLVAVAEKIAAMTIEEAFAERRARADRAAPRKILDREGGEPPRSGDELPPELVQLGPR